MVREAIKHTIPLEYGDVTDIAPDVKLTFHNAGHILGSAVSHFHIGDGLYNVAFSGDIHYKDTRLFKIKAFMIGCALMGLAGALFRGNAGYISPAQFRPTVTFYVFAALIIGGSGSNTGSILGAATFTALLFYLPARLGENLPTFGASSPGNIVDAVSPLGVLNPGPLVAYVAEIGRASCRERV